MPWEVCRTVYYSTKLIYNQWDNSWSSEMLVSNHWTTWCNNPENHYICLCCCENLKSHLNSLLKKMWLIKEKSAVGGQLSMLWNTESPLIYTGLSVLQVTMWSGKESGSMCSDQMWNAPMELFTSLTQYFSKKVIYGWQALLFP